MSRVIFAGDVRASGVAVRRARRQFRPRGRGESGLEAVDWCCAAMRRRRCSTSYDVERSAAADENIRASTRSTDFIAPHSQQERAACGKAVLPLAKDTEFAKRMVNGGRLSAPSVYRFAAVDARCDVVGGGPRPGAQMIDAAAGRRRAPMLTESISPERGTRLQLRAAAIRQWQRRSKLPEAVIASAIGEGAPLRDASGLFAKRYDASSQRRGLSAAAGRLCRGALPDIRRARAVAGRAWRVPAHNEDSS